MQNNNNNNQPPFSNQIQQNQANQANQANQQNQYNPQNQQQYAAYVQQQQQRYYAQQQQQYLMQQRQQQYAYWQSVLKQRQQHQYAHYYQQIAQQYGYPAMVQAINQNHNMNHNMNYNMNNNPHSHSSGGPIILSSEEQPLLIASDNDPKYKRKRRTRKRKKPESDDEDNNINNINNNNNNNDNNNDENDNNHNNYIRNETVSIDIDDDDDDGMGLDKNGYDKNTLINQNEFLPDIDTEFDEWLYFTKKLWKRQRKYKHSVIYDDQNQTHQNKENVLDLTESFSTSDLTEDDSISPSSANTLQLKSAFFKDRNRMKSKQQKVLKNKNVVNIMIKMGLAPPWNEMPKYKKWLKCYKWNT